MKTIEQDSQKELSVYVSALDVFVLMQKNYKDILKDVKLTAEWHIEDCACFHPMSKYQLGWFEAMNLIKEKVNA